MDNLKNCTHCGRDLPRSQFYRDKKRADGLTAYCKDYYAAYYARNRERQKKSSRDAAIQRRYGLTAEEYRALMQQGCTICGSHDKMVMDHDHATLANRAPLCSCCNAGLGMFRDDPERLRQAARYLEEHMLSTSENT